MKYVKQFFLIIFIAFLGELLKELIPLPIPASIYGIILMFAGLVSGVIPLASVKETGKFLVEIMPVMFIPAGAGLINSWGLIADSWFSYLLLITVTTIAVMGISGGITQLFIQKEKRRRDSRTGKEEAEDE